VRRLKSATIAGVETVGVHVAEGVIELNDAPAPAARVSVVYPASDAQSEPRAFFAKLIERARAPGESLARTPMPARNTCQCLREHPEISRVMIENRPESPGDEILALSFVKAASGVATKAKWCGRTMVAAEGSHESHVVVDVVRDFEAVAVVAKPGIAKPVAHEIIERDYLQFRIHTLSLCCDAAQADQKN